MTENQNSSAATVVIDPSGLQGLLDALTNQQYRIYGPVVRENAVTCQEISRIEQLPVGWCDEQSGGHYRLVKSDRPALFDHVVGPQSWKKVLYPAMRKIWSARKAGRSFEVQAPVEDASPKLALLGVRPCELRALAIHDQVLTQSDFDDPHYRRMRDNNFVIAVNCARPGGTCFCTTMGTGPQAKGGFDLALTEVFKDGRHAFVVEVGSEKGQALLGSIQSTTATDSDREAARRVVDQAVAAMKPRFELAGLKERLYARFDSLHWEKVAERCMTCGNCTMVCPTCFCVNVLDTTDLTGKQAERNRCWDTCFSVNFAYIHGGSVRTSGFARYRQWLMHKMGYWQDQFGVPGCVGCGRCITWCPVGIDIAEETAAVIK
jgi:sulfhydrogenase subunit beta (sulfur reductase)